MATLKEEAQAYEPTQKTKNIADLESVDVNVELLTETGKTKDGEEFSYKYAEISFQIIYSFI